MSFDISREPLLRTSIFIFILIILALLESSSPRRRYSVDRKQRWLTNFSLLFTDTLAVRLCFPLAATGVALYAQQRGIGLFNRFELPPYLSWFCGLLILDCLIYWQHRLMHRIPLLWRLHKVHHTDIDLDLSTGIRFHPLEVLLSMLLKTGFILLFGIPAAAVLLFEILLNGFSLYTHSNLALPARLEPWLRRLLVTPDMHRIHHSLDRRETDSNFSFHLSVWDRLFGSYTVAPKLDSGSMPLGLAEYRRAGELGLLNLLRIPFI
ncbi:MAG TPA: sterol desaturase family protein [Gammaproteobacteria bacterium]